MADEQPAEQPQEQPAEEAPAEEAPQEEGGEEPSNPINQAQAILDGIKGENDRLESNIKTLQDIKARDMLGGQSVHTGPAKTQDDKDQEEADRLLNMALGDGKDESSNSGSESPTG